MKSISRCKCPLKPLVAGDILCWQVSGTSKGKSEAYPRALLTLAAAGAGKLRVKTLV